MNTTRIRFYFSFDGTHFKGWQRQKNTKHTIQETFEDCLEKILKARTHLIASGRTDAGVHARIQVAHADFPSSMAEKLLQLPPSLNKSRSLGQPRLMMALNSLLPPSVRVFKVEKVSSRFHSIHDVQKKMYAYFIDTNAVQMPYLKNYAWHLKFPLNWKAMEAAAGHLIGTHDFKAFCAADAGVKTTVRTIFESRFIVHPTDAFTNQPLMAYRIVGSGFLKQMVRSIIGTLVMIGNGNAEPSLIPELLRGASTRADYLRIRQKAGMTAPSKGLWLWDIKY